MIWLWRFLSSVLRLSQALHALVKLELAWATQGAFGSHLKLCEMVVRWWILCCFKWVKDIIWYQQYKYIIRFISMHDASDFVIFACTCTFFKKMDGFKYRVLCQSGGHTCCSPILNMVLVNRWCKKFSHEGPEKCDKISQKKSEGSLSHIYIYICVYSCIFISIYIYVYMFIFYICIYVYLYMTSMTPTKQHSKVCQQNNTPRCVPPSVNSGFIPEFPSSQGVGTSETCDVPGRGGGCWDECAKFGRTHHNPQRK